MPSHDDDDDDSNAAWLYRRCAAARHAMGTPLTALGLSVAILRFLRSLDDDNGDDDCNDDDEDRDEDDDVPVALFEFLRGDRSGARARRRDIDFLFEVGERAEELRGDGELTEEALGEVAAREGEEEDGAGGGADAATSAGGDRSAAVNDPLVEETPETAAKAEASEEEAEREGGTEAGGGAESRVEDDRSAAVDDPMVDDTPENAARARSKEEGDDPQREDAFDGVDFDALRCFQLRARVIGLRYYDKLWKNLKAAGWKHTPTGGYRIPKERRIRTNCDTEDMVRRMYQHFDLDKMNDGTVPEHSDGEETDDKKQKDAFETQNEVEDYLDKFCMPDYQSTPSEIHAQRAASDKKSRPFKRRNKRLRFELLEAAYRAHSKGGSDLPEPKDVDENAAPSMDLPSSSSIGPLEGKARAGGADNDGKEADQYFDRKAGKKPLQSEGAGNDFVVPSRQDCVAEAESLHGRSNADGAFDALEVQCQRQFREWSFSLATKQSILLYGLGSKMTVLTAFGEYLSSEGDVVSLNGYDPTIDLHKFLECLELFFGDKGEPEQSDAQPPAAPNAAARADNTPKRDYRWIAKKAASVAKTFASTKSRPLFLLIHNIDGVGLRSRFAQDAIATLTAQSQKHGSRLIRIVASVDNVNASWLLWTPQVEHKFDWAWKEVHTYRPYIEEVRHLPHEESPKKAKKRRGNQQPGAATAVLKVLAYLAPKHTEVLQGLASMQLSSASNSVSYGSLRDYCVRKMLTTSDTTLRNVMKELSDHNMIASEKDDRGIEHIFVPSALSLQDILDFKPKQSSK